MQHSHIKNYMVSNFQVLETENSDSIKIDTKVISRLFLNILTITCYFKLPPKS